MIAHLLLTLFLAQQPPVERTPSPAPPVSAAPEKPTPLTASEKKLVGRWVLDVPAFAKLVKEQPGLFGLPADSKPEQAAQMLMMSLPMLKAMTVELDGDRGARVVGAGSAIEGGWKIDGDAVALSGDLQKANFSLQIADGGLAIGGIGLKKGAPLKLVPRGKPVTLASLEGEWTMDVDASVSATKAYWEEMKGVLTPAMQARVDESLQNVRAMVEQAAVGVAFAADKATVKAPNLSKESGVTVRGDLVLLRNRGGLKADNGPDVALAMYAEGDTLRMNMSSVVGVLKKIAAKQPASPTPPAK